eukprot:1162009-Pelagomonas_calceolata.AAC.14
MESMHQGESTALAPCNKCKQRKAEAVPFKSGSPCPTGHREDQHGLCTRMLHACVPGYTVRLHACKASVKLGTVQRRVAGLLHKDQHALLLRQ